MELHNFSPNFHELAIPTEMAQIVCGSCRRLLAYQRGAKHVSSCCQTVNLVLEADQVGQVKYGSCAVLLMYPYGGASQVKCSSCQFVTKIEEHNKRPPWSVQQQQGKPTPPKSIS